MNRLATFLGAILVGAGFFVFADFLLSQHSPDPKLDAEIKAIESEIKRVRDEGARYAAGNLLSAQYQLRVAVLSTTRDMLDQKRRAWLKGIRLTYVVQGSEIGKVSPETLATLEKDISKALYDAGVARDKAGQYSGGLLHSLALVEEQTHLVTAALNRQRLTFARIGIALPQTKLDHAVQPPIGKSLDDRGAL